MKYFYLPYLFLILSALVFLFVNDLSAQQLNLNYTRMLGGTSTDMMQDVIYDPRDKSIVFTGDSWGNCGTGDLPPCPSVTGSRDLIVGKVDSNKQIVWIRQYASTHDDIGAKVLPTSNGYAVFGFAATNNGDAANNKYDGDAWLLKLDFQGNLLWSKGYGSPNGSESIRGGMQTADGGFILTGSSSGSGGDIPFQYVNSPFVEDGFVLKTDSMGEIEWIKTMGGTGDDYFLNVFEVNKAYYVTARSISHDHECDDQSWHPAVNTLTDYYLIKLDSVGNYLWNRSFGGSKSEELRDAIFDERDSTIMMIGSTQSRDYMVQSSGPMGGIDPWLIKVDLDGNLKWARVYGDTAWEDGYLNAHIRRTTVEKGYAISYIVSTTLDGQPLPPPPYYGLYDLHLSLLDSAGNVRVDKIIGDTLSEYNGICIEGKDGFVVAGCSESPQFAEGTTFGFRGMYDWFISYMDYNPVTAPAVPPVKNKLSVFPNPADGKVIVKLPRSSLKGVLQIRNVEGKEIWRKQFPSNTESVEVDVNSWISGVYVVSWNTKAEAITVKLSIK